ncbi:MAG TPA: cyclic nucleotide-binding domain-containing protein [Ramlibacter sp.]|nr:cyclic nucleotide-binding domain-containing protein [Ramlibacter sp.]
MTAADGSGPTEAAAELVTSVAPQRPVEAALRAAGLEITGCCERLSQRGDLLRDSPLLQDFTPAEADILGQVMLLARARPGQVLIAEDEASDWMMLLLSGTVDVVKRKVGADADRSDGDTTRLAVVKAGAILGEMSLLDGEPRYASCHAIGEVEVAVLTRQDVAYLIAHEPAVGAKLLVKITQLLAQRLRNTSNQLLRLLSGR